MIGRFLKAKYYPLLSIIFVTVFAYIGVFQNGFILDDPTFIVNWQTAHDFNMVELLKGEVPQGHEGVYRPLRSILYALYYQIYGTSPFGYHLHSILVHLSSTILVYLITKRLTKSNLTAFIAGLLFGLHPVHTESITYISASMEMTGVVFMLLSFYLYLMREQVKRIYLAGSVVSATLAYFTYEMTLTLPILILSYELIVRREKLVKLKHTLLLFLSAGLYLFIRMGLLHVINRGEYLGGSFFLTQLVMAKAFVKYIELLILPMQLSLVHILPGNIPTIAGVDLSRQLLSMQSITDWNVLTGIGLAGVMIFVIFRFKKQMQLTSFFIVWFLVTLLPVMQIIPTQQILSEKYLYIPSIAFVSLLAIFLNFMYTKVSQKKSLSLYRDIITLSFLVLSGWYFWQTIIRVKDFRTDLTIWTAAVGAAPGSASARYNLGTVYFINGQFPKAQVELEQAKSIDNNFLAARNNLGAVYLNLGKYELARNEYLYVLGKGQDFWPVHFGLSQAYQALGEKEQAVLEFQKALQQNPQLNNIIKK